MVWVKAILALAFTAAFYAALIYWLGWLWVVGIIVGCLVILVGMAGFAPEYFKDKFHLPK